MSRMARALALLLAALAAFELARFALRPYPVDFISYWAAASLALRDQAAAAYDIALHHAQQDRAVTSSNLLPFPYPPPFLLLLLPLGLLPYAAALILWVCATFPAYFAAARRLLPVPGGAWLVCAFPPLLANAVLGQNAFLTAALFLAGMLALPRRPLAGGLLLGCLVIKPHLGLLLPLALVAGREWRAFAGATASFLGLLLLGLLAFGAAAYAAFFEILPVYAEATSAGRVGFAKAATIYGSLRHFGLGESAAWAIHGAAALAAALLVVRAWWSGGAAKAPMLAAATIVASPYLFVYDMLILVLPFAWLIGQGLRHGFRRGEPALLAILWLLPGVQMLAGVSVSALVAPALLALIWTRRPSHDQSEP